MKFGCYLIDVDDAADAPYLGGLEAEGSVGELMSVICEIADIELDTLSIFGGIGKADLATNSVFATIGIDAEDAVRLKNHREILGLGVLCKYGQD